MWIGSYIGENPTFVSQYYNGEVAMELVPQGTLAEKMRAGGAGVPAFFTRTGLGTVVETGGYPIKYGPNRKVEIAAEPKPVQEFEGKKYLLEKAIRSDYAMIKAWKGDKYGNLVFHHTAQNFNPDCAKAGKITIAEVEHLVEPGELSSSEINLPGVYVQRIVHCTSYEHRIHKLTLRDAGDHSGRTEEKVEDSKEQREKIARRVAKEFPHGSYINLGIGIPTLAANFIPDGVWVNIHSENGVLGAGPYPESGHQDPDVVNAGKETITIAPGGCTFCSSESFAMIRGKHIEVTVLGCLQVSAEGDIASWEIVSSIHNLCIYVCNILVMTYFLL
jgi:3-oxoacid CoA-transferase